MHRAALRFRQSSGYEIGIEFPLSPGLVRGRRRHLHPTLMSLRQAPTDPINSRDSTKISARSAGGASETIPRPINKALEKGARQPPFGSRVSHSSSEMSIPDLRFRCDDKGPSTSLKSMSSFEPVVSASFAQTARRELESSAVKRDAYDFPQWANGANQGIHRRPAPRVSSPSHRANF